MLSGRQVALAAGVLLLGVSTALVFQRPASYQPPETPAIDQGLVLHRNNSARPLRVPSESQTSMQPVPPPGTDRALASVPTRDSEFTPRTLPAADDAQQTAGQHTPPPFPAYPGLVSLPRVHEENELAALPRRHPLDELAPAKQHVIKDGDTLESIAARYLGDAARHHEIFAANRHVLAHPELLPIGVSITIPSGAKAQPAPSPSNADGLVPVPWRRQ